MPRDALSLRDAFTSPGALDTPYLDPRDGLVWIDDFISSTYSTLAVTAGGGHSVGMANADAPGTDQQTVTALGDACRALANANGIFFGGGGIEWHLLFRVRLSALSNGVDNIVVRGPVGDNAAAADHTDGIYLEYDFATHGDHNWRLCCAANAVRTKTNTGIAVVAGSYITGDIRVSPDGLAVTCTIDGVVAPVSVTTNIPATSARLAFPTVQAVKQLGAGALSATWDFYGVTAKFNPRRV